MHSRDRGEMPGPVRIVTFSTHNDPLDHVMAIVDRRIVVLHRLILWPESFPN